MTHEEIKFRESIGLITRLEYKQFDYFDVGDMVVYKPNGLIFRVENNKMLKWMRENKNYSSLESPLKQTTI